MTCGMKYVTVYLMCMLLSFLIKSYFLILYTAEPIISSLQATARGQTRWFGYIMCVFHLWMETPLVRKAMEMRNSNTWISKKKNNSTLTLFNFFIIIIMLLVLFWHYINPHLSPPFSISSPFITFFILLCALSILLSYHFPCPASISPAGKLTS